MSNVKPIFSWLGHSTPRDNGTGTGLEHLTKQPAPFEKPTQPKPAQPKDESYCPVEAQGLLYHIVTKWTLSTKAISMLKAYYKKGMSAIELHTVLNLHNSRLPGQPVQNIPKDTGIIHYIPIYSNTSRMEIERDAKHSALQHQKYFLSFRFNTKNEAFVIIQRSKVNDFINARKKEQQLIHERHLKTYYKEVVSIKGIS